MATKANTPPTEMFPHCKKHPSANALVNASQRDNHQLIGKGSDQASRVALVARAKFKFTFAGR
jgi:hypothetical protein